MKANGEIQITEELKITNPELNIKDIYINCVFTDLEGNKHSRLMLLDANTTDLTNVNILSSMNEHEVLKNFK